MTIIERIEDAWWVVSYRWHKWRADRKREQAKRDRAHDFYQRGVLCLVALTLPLQACVPDGGYDAVAGAVVASLLVALASIFAFVAHFELRSTGAGRRESRRMSFALVVAAVLIVCACGPTTSDAMRAHQALYVECVTNWQRIEAMDAPASERLRLYEAEGARCREAGLALCEPTGTCGEFGR